MKNVPSDSSNLSSAVNGKQDCELTNAGAIATKWNKNALIEKILTHIVGSIKK